MYLLDTNGIASSPSTPRSPGEALASTFPIRARFATP